MPNQITTENNLNRKYSKILLEIEKFIKEKKKKPKIFEGKVKEITRDNILIIKLKSLNPPKISRNSLVLIKLNNVDIEATVEEFYNSNLKLKVNEDISKFKEQEVTIDIDRVNVTLERLNKIIENIKKGEINKDKLKIFDFIIGDVEPKYNQKNITISKDLNEEQKEAIINSIKSEDFHLIIGPPGTGKTYVIEELIRQFIKKDKKILITAHSNITVDNILNRLSKEDIKNLVRIGPFDEIDKKIKDFSIYEKIKKHKDWKEIEKLIKIKEGLYKLIPKIKNKREEIQKQINKNKNLKEIFLEEYNSLFSERDKYQKLISTSFIDKNLINPTFINNEIIRLNNKSEVCLFLCKNILVMNRLQTKIPKKEDIENLIKITRNIKITIFSKKISSFFSEKDKEKLNQLKKECIKNKNYLREIYELQEKYSNLEELNNKDYCELYSDKQGYPDKDSLNLEFKAYKLLEEEYLPAFREQELLDIDKKSFDLDKEVYNLHINLLANRIGLLDVNIKNLNTELYIQINSRDNAHNEYVNLINSIEYYDKQINCLKRNIVLEIINSSNLIASTIISSCHPFLNNIEFDVVIIDEATQVASFMSLLPLLKCKKFILVGDDKQIQPIEEEDISKEMNLSIFNKLLHNYPKAQTFLPIQYRMNKAIVRISNEIFYEGKLRTSEKAAERILNLKEGKHFFLNPKIPIIFIDTSKAEYYEDEVGIGSANTKEAEYVSYIVSLFVKKKIKSSDIGVVTPYVKQRNLIRDFIKKIKINNIEVDTAHGFQGKEKDVMIMSFSRSKKYSFPQYLLKFLENETLINVAITRARKKLILVGNSKTLCRSELLNKVINKIGKENSIIL